MKKLILLLALLSTNALARDVKEMYLQYAEDVQIVLTNEPCPLPKTGNYQLNFAYAVNTRTQERITGCFTHDDNYIIVQLTDSTNKKHYEFKLNPDVFQLRPTL
jgi:hypothetical protein